jgi:ketosteroid isomerase-like protein
MRLPTTLLAAILFATTAVSTAAAPAAAPVEDLLAAAHGTIDAANAGWVPAMKRRDARAIAAFYAVDGAFIKADGESVRGRAAVEKMYADRMTSDFVLKSGALAQDGVVVAGDLIYEWGHAEMDFERGGKAGRAGGKYMTVWRRNDAGKWEIIRNVVF